MRQGELAVNDFDPPLPRTGAALSLDGRYRYRLWRQWADGRVVTFIMLNPSTADASEDDPTIRKCIGFAKRLGFGRLEVVNLFAWRATNPNALRDVVEPVGIENDQTILERCLGADLVIAAWGATEFPSRLVWRRQQQVCALLRGAGVQTQCLGLSQEGRPRHPLMLPYETALQPWASR